MLAQITSINVDVWITYALLIAILVRQGRILNLLKKSR